MYDKFNREISYLRISITDRCNLRCKYCMPEEGVRLLKHEDILTFDEIVELVQVAVGMGIHKFRLTGGEPLVRRGVADLVRMVASIKGVDDLSLSTNGVLLDKLAQPLWDAGMRRINVSLDTLDPEEYSKITRGGNLNDVLAGLQKAKEVGFHPIKINCVVAQNSKEPSAMAVREYSLQNGFEPRFIHRMELAEGTFDTVEGGDGGNCASCNRIRVTASGMMMPCLFSELGFSVRELGPAEAIRQAIEAKPCCGTHNTTGMFYSIGG